MSFESKPVYDGNNDRVYSGFASGQWLENTQVLLLTSTVEQQTRLCLCRLVSNYHCVAETCASQHELHGLCFGVATLC